MEWSFIPTVVVFTYIYVCAKLHRTEHPKKVNFTYFSLKNKINCLLDLFPQKGAVSPDSTQIHLHLFIQQIFTESLRCVKCFCKHWVHD